MSTINPATHRYDIPDAMYQMYVKLSGKKNPKPFIEKVLNAYIYDALTGQQSGVANINKIPVDATASGGRLTQTPYVNLDASQHVTVRYFDDRLRARRKNLGCDVNPFDKLFASAWGWSCDQFGGETELVEHLEEMTALPNGRRLRNPRAVVIKRWNEAGRP